MALLSLILAKKNGTTAIISQIFSLWNDDLLSAAMKNQGVVEGGRIDMRGYWDVKAQGEGNNRPVIRGLEPQF